MSTGIIGAGLGSGLFGLAGKAIGSAITPKPSPAPSPAPPPVMPNADDAKVAAERKRAIAAMQQRSGRASTILTTNSDTLGG